MQGGRRESKSCDLRGIPGFVPIIHHARPFYIIVHVHHAGFTAGTRYEGQTCTEDNRAAHSNGFQNAISLSIDSTDPQ